jgi:hypothetical protein
MDENSNQLAYLFITAQNLIITTKVKAFMNANNDLVY